MYKMKLKVAFLIALVVCVLKIEKIHSLQEDDMNTYRTRIDLNDPYWGYLSSGILKSHSGFSYTPNRRKTLLLSAPPGYSIFAAVRLLDFRPDTQDTLALYANGTTDSFFWTNTLRSRNRIYDSREERYTLYAKKGQLVVTFYTGPGSTYGYDGFELIYTVQAEWTDCSSSDFRCNNMRCIAKSLKCDGHNHCGDRSDQYNCNLIPGPGRGRTVGIVGGVIFLVIAAGCVIFITIRRATRSQTEASLPEYDPPPAYPQTQYYPPPPPPYSPYSNYNQGVNNPGFR